MTTSFNYILIISRIFLFIVVAGFSQASFCRADCEVNNFQHGHWIQRTENDGLEPAIDPCNPPTGENFSFAVRTRGCGFVSGDDCTGCTYTMKCPNGNDIDGKLKTHCDYYMINSNCGIPPKFENGCCKVDARGTNTCDEEIEYMSIAFSQDAYAIKQWICKDKCPNDPDKTEPGICGCGVADVDSDSDGTLDCNDTCPNDLNKTEPGMCGCDKPDIDSDGDGMYDCVDDKNDGLPELEC